VFRAWRFSFALTLSFQFTVCFQLPLHQEVRWFTRLLRKSRVLHILTSGHPPPPPPATLTTRLASSSQGSTRYVQGKQSRPHQCAPRPTRLQVVLNSDAVEFGGLGRIDERVGWPAVTCRFACSSRVAGAALHHPGAIQQQVTRGHVCKHPLQL
jgi:hypothetical protein